MRNDDLTIIELNREQVAENLPKRKSDSYKGDYGHVLCIGGSFEMAGAITLSAMAALYSGAGLVTVATDSRNFSAIHTSCPELMCVDYSDFDNLKDYIQQADTVLLGPGLGRSDFIKGLVQQVIHEVADDQFLVVDADGLYHLSQSNEITLPQYTVLTPHLGEWERLTGISPNQSSLDKNKKWQEKLQATIVLKSDQTEVYTGSQVYRNHGGNPGMAVGGMGDTLAGMISGFLKQYSDFSQAVSSAVFIHSYIGDLIYQDNYIVLPHQVIDRIPQTLKLLSR